MSQDVDTQSLAEKGRICGSILNALTGRVWSAFPPPSRPSRSVRGARSAPHCDAAAPPRRRQAPSAPQRFKMADKDGSGSVELSELVNFVH